MSTPSPVPLDNFDPVSPYAPKWAQAQNADPQPSVEEAEAPRPNGIETDNDARILDEIEASLRAMIAVNHTEPAEAARLSEISRVAAEHLARQEEEMAAAEPTAAEPPVADDPAPEFDERSAAYDERPDTAEAQAMYRDPRTPPWLLPRSLEPQPVPEPWPRPRKRSKSNSMFLRFGLAATGAAVVAAVVIKDVPSYVVGLVRGPITDLTTNAAAVFNEGKASPLQVRLDAVQKETERVPAPSLQYAVANADTAPQARPIAVKTETVRSEPRRETVMTPWPSPEQAKRPEPWQQPSPPARAPEQAQTPAPAPAPAAANTAPPSPPRTLSAEEIAMLRKMGDDYIVAGDFVGARAVLERAADAGDASAAFAIASTYDPVVLVRFKVRGLEPDIVKAGFWYERARELGSSEAPRRLQAMMATRGN